MTTPDSTRPVAAPAPDGVRPEDYEAALSALIDAARYHADDCYIRPVERECDCGLIQAREVAREILARSRGTGS